ncbi:UNVERIFIED_CONTAM: hypothetical protein Slati_4548900 [Sesamum latifolium]|uniref:DUF4218 domain-containing protein n=1 Tax=Sesamum latifolium TaxID=2727402 RepID=A0AAW2RRB8_9LAMI
MVFKTANLNGFLVTYSNKSRVYPGKGTEEKDMCMEVVPVAFREVLPKFVWSALAEVSLLFQVLCLTTLDVKKVQELEENIAVIMCNLEKIFPPTFFESMEHLIIHLAYEARVGGLVQCMWMYTFERFLYTEHQHPVPPRPQNLPSQHNFRKSNLCLAYSSTDGIQMLRSDQLPVADAPTEESMQQQDEEAADPSPTVILGFKF